MTSHDAAPASLYRVVVNHEEQYSIWPVHRDIPAGWSATGTVGPRSECLSHIEAVWTDLRPVSRRRPSGPER